MLRNLWLHPEVWWSPIPRNLQGSKQRIKEGESTLWGLPKLRIPGLLKHIRSRHGSVRVQPDISIYDSTTKNLLELNLWQMEVLSGASICPVSLSCQLCKSDTFNRFPTITQWSTAYWPALLLSAQSTAIIQGHSEAPKRVLHNRSNRQLPSTISDPS